MAFWKKSTPPTGSDQALIPSSPGNQPSNTPNSHPADVARTTETASAAKGTETQAEEESAPLQARQGKIRSALGTGTVIQGKLSFDTPVRIDGKLSGEIFSTKAIIVGETGQIEASVEVAELVVMGTVKGDVKASERVEIASTGRIEGRIFAPSLIVAPGGILNATCDMGSGLKAAAEAKAVKAAAGTEIMTQGSLNLGGVFIPVKKDVADSSGSRDKDAAEPSADEISLH